MPSATAEAEGAVWVPSDGAANCAIANSTTCLNPTDPISYLKQTPIYFIILQLEHNDYTNKLEIRW